MIISTAQLTRQTTNTTPSNVYQWYVSGSDQAVEFECISSFHVDADYTKVGFSQVIQTFYYTAATGLVMVGATTDASIVAREQSSMTTIPYVELQVDNVNLAINIVLHGTTDTIDWDLSILSRQF